MAIECGTIEYSGGSQDGRFASSICSARCMTRGRLLRLGLALATRSVARVALLVGLLPARLHAAPPTAPNRPPPNPRRGTTRATHATRRGSSTPYTLGIIRIKNKDDDDDGGLLLLCIIISSGHSRAGGCEVALVRRECVPTHRTSPRSRRGRGQRQCSAGSRVGLPSLSARR